VSVAIAGGVLAISGTAAFAYWTAQAPNAYRKVSFPLTYAAEAEQWH
jgi:hypothetical protein